MSQRLEVMLTSCRPDGVWTWRAAGAREPKGVMEAELVPADAAVGDILRVEAEINLDGIAVRQVLPPKADKPAPARVEHLGTQKFTEGVTGPTTSGRFERSGKDRGDRGRRRHDGAGRDRRGGGAGRERRDGGRPQRAGAGGQGPRERPPRLRAASTHRDAWLATLDPVQKVVAERLVNEGIRAVRQSISEQESAESPAEAPEQPVGAVSATVAVVEDLFSALRAADWRDRAEAARGITDEVDLRDLRSVVAGTPPDLPDDGVRAMADELRGKLEARVDREHSAWIADLGSLIRKGRLITALRVSRRPPKTGTPLPESLGRSLQEAAGAQLDAEADDDLWVRMLEAAAQSPVRLVLVAGDVPAEPSERLLRTVRRFGDRLPALREQFAAHLDPPAQPTGTGEDEAEDAGELAEPAAPVEPAEAEAGAGEPVPSADADPAEEVAEPAGEVEVA
jgi:hypothetical protein